MLGCSTFEEAVLAGHAVVHLVDTIPDPGQLEGTNGALSGKLTGILQIAIVWSE